MPHRCREFCYNFKTFMNDLSGCSGSTSAPLQDPYWMRHAVLEIRGTARTSNHICNRTSPLQRLCHLATNCDSAQTHVKTIRKRAAIPLSGIAPGQSFSSLSCLAFVSQIASSPYKPTCLTPPQNTSICTTTSTTLQSPSSILSSIPHIPQHA